MLKRAGGAELERRRSTTSEKQRLLAAITKARTRMPLRSTLAILGLLPGRYHAWVNRQQRCQLDDRPSCARRRPGRLSFDEVRKLGDMVI